MDCALYFIIFSVINLAAIILALKSFSRDILKELSEDSEQVKLQKEKIDLLERDIKAMHRRFETLNKIIVEKLYQNK